MCCVKSECWATRVCSGSSMFWFLSLFWAGVCVGVECVSRIKYVSGESVPYGGIVSLGLECVLVFTLCLGGILFWGGSVCQGGVCVWSGMLFSVRISVGLGVCNWAGGCVGARACICTGVCFWD